MYNGYTPTKNQSKLDQIRYNMQHHGHTDIYEGLGQMEQVFGHDRTMELICYVYTPEGFRMVLAEFQQEVELAAGTQLDLEHAIWTLDGGY